MPDPSVAILATEIWTEEGVNHLNKQPDFHSGKYPDFIFRIRFSLKKTGSNLFGNEKKNIYILDRHKIKTIYMKIYKKYKIYSLLQVGSGSGKKNYGSGSLPLDFSKNIKKT